MKENLSDKKAAMEQAAPGDWFNKAETLSEALPYLREHAGKTFVIKYGGHAMGDEELARLFGDRRSVNEAVGITPVIVHGVTTN